ncbi:putative glycolipid-binding domain-containing protein [Streptomyces pseudogriseolus]|uniref:putative glycolipid-binding domain-containing protein n=1 Tax=Streptomyces pseudogriseolus TaxID=36817 RepID=UPI0034730EC1
MPVSRVITWEVTASGGYETVWAVFDGDGLRARGRAVGTLPEPYWITYELLTGDASGSRSLDLRHDGRGGWTADGRRVDALDGALDCDLGLCPLTNTMPVLRHGLHRTPGEREFLMAWVSVPGLDVEPSRQTYTHLGPGRVRYASGDFRSDLTFDADGCVVGYPQLAQRLAPR